MQVYRKNYSNEKLQRFLSLTSVLWCISALTVSSVGQRLSAIFMITSIIMGGMCLSRGSVAGKDRLHEAEEVDTDKLKSLYKKLLSVCLVAAVIGSFCVAVFKEKDLSSAYGVYVYISETVLPLFVIAVPFYVKAIYTSAENNVCGMSFDRTAERKILRGRNVILLICAFLISYAVLFYAAPTIYKGSPEYLRAQDNAASFDISAVAEFKSEKASYENAEKELSLMPFYSELTQVILKDDTLAVTYNAETDSKTVICNATALFALNDDLRRIDFVFSDGTVTMFRSNTVALYDDFTQILNTWQTSVTAKMNDTDSAELLKKAVGQ